MPSDALLGIRAFVYTLVACITKAISFLPMPQAMDSDGAIAC